MPPRRPSRAPVRRTSRPRTTARRSPSTKRQWRSTFAGGAASPRFEQHVHGHDESLHAPSFSGGSITVTFNAGQRPTTTAVNCVPGSARDRSGLGLHRHLSPTRAPGDEVRSRPARSPSRARARAAAPRRSRARPAPSSPNGNALTFTSSRCYGDVHTLGDRHRHAHDHRHLRREPRARHMPRARTGTFALTVDQALDLDDRSPAARHPSPSARLRRAPRSSPTQTGGQSRSRPGPSLSARRLLPRGRSGSDHLHLGPGRRDHDLVLRRDLHAHGECRHAHGQRLLRRQHDPCRELRPGRVRAHRDRALDLDDRHLQPGIRRLRPGFDVHHGRRRQRLGDEVVPDRDRHSQRDACCLGDVQLGPPAPWPRSA